MSKTTTNNYSEEETIWDKTANTIKSVGLTIIVLAPWILIIGFFIYIWYLQIHPGFNIGTSNPDDCIPNYMDGCDL